MTEKEAIELHIGENLHRIEVMEEFLRINPNADDKECNKNIQILTKINGALQEIQQYREIGTVEEIEGLNFSSNQLRLVNLVEEYKEKLKAYEEIGTVEECRKARERQIGKKPVKDGYNHDCCPNCGWIVCQDEYGGRYLPHCENCGQAINWLK